MKKKRFTEEQIIAILREGEGSGQIKEFARRHGIAETRFYRWRAKYGGMSESETRWLKKMVADQALENARVKDVVGRKW